MKKIEIKINNDSARLMRYKDTFFVKYGEGKIKCSLGEVNEMINALNLLRVAGSTDLMTLICDYFIGDNDVINFMNLIQVKPNRKNLIKLVLGKRRKRELVKIRHAYSYYSKIIDSNKTLRTIGCNLGDRDHSTIIHAVKTFNNLKTRDYKKIKEDLDTILLNKKV